MGLNSSFVQCFAKPAHPAHKLTGPMGKSCHSDWIGCFWACEYPERPHEDGKTCYDANCPACLIAAQAAVINNDGGDLGIGDDGELATLAEWVALVLEEELGDCT